LEKYGDDILEINEKDIQKYDLLKHAENIY